MVSESKVVGTKHDRLFNIRKGKSRDMRSTVPLQLYKTQLSLISRRENKNFPDILFGSEYPENV